MDSQEDKNQHFMQLFLTSQRRLYSYVMTMVASPTDADDIVQDVASVMWKKFDEYEPGTDFTAWAIKIAKYKLYNYYRDKATHNKKFSQKGIEIIEKIESRQAGKEDARIEALKNCLNKLKQTDREILSLRYEEGQTLKKLSGRLDLNINTLYSKISKLHNMLLNCVKKSMHE